MAGEAADMAGNDRALAFARQALSEVRPEDVMLRGLLLTDLSTYAWQAGDLETAREAQLEALDVLPSSPQSHERALAVAELASLLMVSGQNADAQVRAEEAIEIARAVGARRIEGHALNTLGVALVSQGSFDQGLHHLESALDIARELGAGDDVMRGYVNMSHVLREAGRDVESLALKAEALEAGKKLGLERSWNAFLAAGAAHIHLLKSDYAACDSLIDYVLGLDPPPESASYAFGVRAALRIIRGDLAGAEADLDRATDYWGRDADIWLNRAPIAIGRMEIALARRDYEAAHVVAQEALDRVPHGSSYRVEKFETLAWAVRVEADRAEHARDVNDGALEDDAIATASALIDSIDGALNASAQLEPQQAHAAHAAAEAARARGVADVELWRAAVARLDSLQPRSAAYARWRLTEALLRSGAPAAAATAVLREAADAARVLGDAALQHEIQALARRARVPLDDVGEAAGDAPVVPDAVAEFGLTQREAEVLQLIAEGLTNREIGGRLFITEKTASVHVSRILAKVGVRSRVEAAGAAYRLGLVSPPTEDPT
jgi:ATP/maltotriose-dependent transcriptional regulator MalT